MPGGGGLSELGTVHREFAILILYLLATLLFLWPAPLQLRTNIVGGDFMYPTLWTFDAASQGLLQHGMPPFETRSLNFPDGGSLTFVGWSFIFVVALFRGLGGSVLLGTNLALVLHLVLGCYLAYRLALRVSGRRPESAVGGLVFGLSPYVLSLVWNGQIEKLSHGFIPAVVLCVLAFCADRRTWALPVLGLTFGVLLATSPYNAIFAAFLAVATSLFLLIRAEGKARLASLARSAIAAGVCFVGCLPYLAYLHGTSGSDLEPLFRPSPMPQLPGVHWPSDAMNNATVMGWFLPGKSPWGLGDAFQFPVLHVHYLGWVCLVLSLAGLLWQTKGEPRRRTAASLALVGTAALAFLVAHGYCLLVGASSSGSSSSTISLPLMWMYQLVPAIGAFAVPYRAVAVVTLCLGVLTALGLRRIGARWTTRRRWLLCILAGAAIVAETRWLSPVPFPLPSRTAVAPQVYRDIAARSGCGAVLDVPNEAQGLGAGANLPFIYHQSSHGRPTVLHLHYGPLHEPRMTPFQRGLARAGGRSTERSLRPEEDTYLLDFGFVVLHENRLSGQTLEAVRGYLDTHLRLDRVYPQDGIRLYTPVPARDGGHMETPYRMNGDHAGGCDGGDTS